jgi:hypothetical protein
VNTGHDLRLKTRTEKITPKDAPRVLRIRRVLRQWSHWIVKHQLISSHRVHVTLDIQCPRSHPLAIRTFSFKRASLMGLLGRTAAAVMGAFVLESDIVIVVLGYWVRLRGS